MPADPAFYGDLTGLENLDLLAAVRGCGSEDREWAAGLLELEAADLRRPVRGYSSGMVQKLALVQAVQHRPDLVILDEPANRLDPLAHRRFEELVRTIAADGRTVFLSSHTLSEVQDVCDRVAMIRAGRLRAVEAVADLQRLAARRVHAVYRHPPARIPDGLSNVELDGNQLTARLAGGHVEVLRALIADPDLVDLTVEPPTLEDAFVELYASQEA
jgi:ABC-2 type transport system ATP-binding protein